MATPATATAAMSTPAMSTATPDAATPGVGEEELVLEALASAYVSSGTTARDSIVSWILYRWGAPYDIYDCIHLLKQCQGLAVG